MVAAPRGMPAPATGHCRESGSGFRPSEGPGCKQSEIMQICRYGKPEPGGTAFVMRGVRDVTAQGIDESDGGQIAVRDGPSATVRPARAALHVLPHSSRGDRPLRRVRIAWAACGMI